MFMQQIIFIHGGETFATYEDYIKSLEKGTFELPENEEVKRWKYTLEEELEDTQVIMPAMPSKYNAKYREWKIWFKKVAEYAEEGVVLIGHSLGGLFLAKYLSENDFLKKIKATFLIAAPYNTEGSGHSLADFEIPQDLSKLESQGGKIFIYHSEDDFVVPFSALDKYAKALPSAKKVIFKDRGHFLQESFPELVEDIRSLSS